MKMLVYYGSTLPIETPRIVKNEVGRDFGFAFYTTDSRHQAERWAKRRAMLQSRSGNHQVTPVVSIYGWDETVAGLLVKKFDGSTMEWLDMVVRCRRGLCVKKTHWNGCCLKK